ncbi:GNAT family N-acetyltransferase [Wenyingzhuangia sp. chi5]|uniref:GNAT family N-acetyltransferase n=1 Tax=Wenyingzhuangia gilva TaxID=3057677 RepID=A0ABT8VPP1_9FLAO|nr:GNAT family N-acetyltransferase [Wenyingzhuangia sp. chi5]MDO3693941.1 GNAT family N-acetyltransferase [Wenyingzhuangia sp. chi5]
MKNQFRKATLDDVIAIWDILKQAIERRKQEGSNQWQDGYPNLEVIKKDIEKHVGFVLTENETIVGYAAVLINDEPEYENIKGKWLTDDDFVVFHRVAISENHLGKGLAKKMMSCIEQYALDNDIYSIKADTNFDNVAMLGIFKKLGYAYCGKVYFRNSPREAYEKSLK